MIIDLNIIVDGDLSAEYNLKRHNTPLSSLPNRVKLSVNCLLLQTQDTNILIDTGIGNTYFEYDKRYSISKPRKLLAELNVLGVEPKNIDIVVNTHLHFDHSDGNFDKNGDPVFKNAYHYIQKAEYEEFMKTSDISRKESFKKLEDSGMLKLVSEDHLIEEGIELISSESHTRGFQYVVFNFSGIEYIFPGDIIPTLWHLNNDNIADIDHDKMKLRNAKKTIIERALENNSIIFYQHSTGMKFSRLKRTKNGVRPIRVAGNFIGRLN